MSGLTLKIELDGEVRRVRGWMQDGVEPTIQSVRGVVCELFGIQESHLSDVKYRDEEGDLCTLIGATLPDAIEIAKNQSNVLRITCSVKRETVASSAVACADVAPTEESEYNMIEERATDPGSSVLSQSQANTAVQDSNIDSQCEENDNMPRASPSSAISDVDEAARGPQENMPEHAAELRRTMAERLQRARPQLVEGFEHFKKQIVNDFQITRDDMKGAFDTSPSSRSDESQQPGTIRKIGNVASNAAGAVVACRLLPVRAVRLAAQGVAAVAGTSGSADTVPQDVVEETETAATSPAEHTTSEDNTLPHDEHEARDDVTHFKQQVVRDFQTARDEVTAAFQCVLGNSTEPASEDTAAASVGSTAQQKARVKEMVPKVASTIAGCTVAASLAPVRAVRLAVASYAAHTSAAAADAVQPPPPDVVSTDVPQEDAQIAADEALARRLQAEWDAQP